MPEGYSVKAILSAEDKNFSSTMSKAASGLDSLTGKLTKGLGFGVLAGIGQQAFSTITSAAGSFISELGNTSAAWQTFEKNATMNGHTIAEINATKKSLQAFAQQTIYSASDMSTTFAQLDAVGIKSAENLVKGFGGLAAAAENPTQAMKTLSQQGVQMAAKPTVAWQDFKLMLEQTPAGISAIAKEMGMTTSEMVTAVQDGKVKTEDFFAAIEKVGTSEAFTDLATTYKTAGQAMDGLSETITNTLQPAFDLLQGHAIGAIEKVIDMVGSIDGEAIAGTIKEVVDAFENGGIEGALNKVIALADKLPDSFKQIAAVGGASLTTMMAGSFFQSETWAGLKGGIGSVADLATSIPGKLGKSAGSMLGTAKNVGGVMAKIVPSGIKGKVANLNAGFRQFVLTGNAVRKGMTNMFLSGTKVGQLFARIGPVVSQSTGMIGNGILTVGGQMASGLQTMMGLAMKALLPAALIATALAGLGLLYQKFGDQIDQMLNMAQTKGPEIISGLINGITSQLPTLIASGAQLVSGLMDTVTANAPTVIQGGVQLVQSLVQGLASSLPTLIPSAINMVMTLVSGILSAIPSLISTGMQLLLALAQGVVSNLPLMIAQGMAAIQSFGQSIQSNLPTILSTAAQIVMTLVTGIVQNLPTIIQNGITLITSLVQGIIENLPMILGTAAQVIGTLAEGLVQAIPTLIAAIPQLVMALINTIMETDWAAVGTDILNAIGEGLFSGFTSIGDKIGGLFSGLTGWGEGGQQGGNQLTTAAASEVQATAGVLNTAASTAGSEAGMSMGTGFETGITTGFSSAQGIVTTTTDQIVVSMQSASAGAASAGTQTGQSYSTAISSGMQGAQTAVQNAGNQIGATLTATTAKGKSAGTMLGTGYSVAVKAGMTKAQTAVKTATTQMGAALTAFTSKARSSGQQAGNGFSSGLQNGMRRSVSSTSSIVSRVTSIMRSGYGRAYSAGSYMGQGLVNGLNSKYGAVAAAASRLAAKAMEAMAAAAKIGSPSKITTQYGRWIGDGLINGTEDRIGKVRHAMQRLADMSSFDNLQPAYAGAFGGSLSEDYNYMMESSYEIHVHTDLNGREVAHEIVDDLTDIQDKKTRNNNRRKGIK